MMSPVLSAYLDVIRLLAAIVVFLSHAGTQAMSGGLLWQFERVAEDAVAVFFALSGFVIGYATDQRDRTATAFATSRIARIYSVAIPAVALTFAADTLGGWLKPDLYAAFPDMTPAVILAGLFNGLLFTAEIWSRHVWVGSNLPYWSLGFEVWYYVAFAFLAFAPRPWGGVAAAAVMLCVGPRIAVYFPVWLLGWATWRATRRFRPGVFASLGLLLASSVGGAVLLASPGPTQSLFAPITLTPAGLASYAHYYALAGLFCLHVLSMAVLAPHLPAPPPWAMHLVRQLGQQTFALYLLHRPLLFLMVAVSPGRSRHGKAGCWCSSSSRC
jgi:peptidoglycan/LPS O-acetylase OafA/YrhL